MNTPARVEQTACEKLSQNTRGWPGAPWWPRGGGGGGSGGGETHHCIWSTLLYGRNQKHCKAILLQLTNKFFKKTNEICLSPCFFLLIGMWTEDLGLEKPSWINRTTKLCAIQKKAPSPYRPRCPGDPCTSIRKRPFFLQTDSTSALGCLIRWLIIGLISAPISVFPPATGHDQQNHMWQLSWERRSQRTE